MMSRRNAGRFILVQRSAKEAAVANKSWAAGIAVQLMLDVVSRQAPQRDLGAFSRDHRLAQMARSGRRPRRAEISAETPSRPQRIVRELVSSIEILK